MGRNHDADNGSWCIKVCLLCGSSGVHCACAGSANKLYVCGDCTPAAPDSIEELANCIEAAKDLRHVKYAMRTTSCGLRHVDYAKWTTPCELRRMDYAVWTMPCELRRMDYFMRITPYGLRHVDYAM
ncbi:hypothetical protein HF086_009018 [Spodoptera exigua]|uniref:PHF7/G2E3-like PHD zinc finger domain-containing protein n=1 Tax=Spodoptera exigua TaxID=7107 RepID=A0A922M8V0_SPOEX|nr:hypothetical protein HF086_009018 [Spodoptera exigua]